MEVSDGLGLAEGLITLVILAGAYVINGLKARTDKLEANLKEELALIRLEQKDNMIRLLNNQATLFEHDRQDLKENHAQQLKVERDIGRLEKN